MYYRIDDTQGETAIPPVRPKRGIKKGKGKALESAKNSEESTSSSNTENRINFDQEAFSCAVQNILGKQHQLDSLDYASPAHLDFSV